MDREPIAFLSPDSLIPRDLTRQWIQGTGPAAKPSAPIDRSIRNVAYALLSGADGWTFDGEDALGQIGTMSLDNQRNLKLAVAVGMNRWAEGLYPLLRELFAQRRSVTTFGPYSPSQAVTMKRMGIEGIYLGGWATSAKGSIHEDPGPDLASYPLSHVLNEAAVIVRALLAADKNQRFARSRMSDEQQEATPEHDFRPFIIADAEKQGRREARQRDFHRHQRSATGCPRTRMRTRSP